MVEITDAGLQEVRPVTWEPGRQLARLKGTLDTLLTSAEYESAEERYCQITLTDAHRPARAMERVRERFPHTLVLGFEPTGGVARKESYRKRVSRAVDDVELAAGFVEHVTGRPADDLERADLLEAVEATRMMEHSA
jgi:exonuclease SbcD